MHPPTMSHGAPDDVDEILSGEADLQKVADDDPTGGTRDTAHLDGGDTEFRVGMSKD